MAVMAKGPVWDEMRLICPNCDAHYEVDESVIPDSGRDVQCSACGHTWYQMCARMLAEGHGAARESEALPDTASWEGAEPEPAGQVAAQHDDEDEDGAENAPYADAAAPEPDPARRMLDESLLAILREEAEHEARARKAEGSSLETQPDLGLTAIPAALAARAAASAPPPAEYAAQLRPDPAEAINDPGPRRDRLPNIEIINSTLRATSERVGDILGNDTENLVRRRSGFRFGFTLMLVLAATATGAYLFAERLGTAVPTLQPALAEYTRQVESGRLWLDTQMRVITEKLRPQG